jgi:hypothetical protein
MGVPNVWRLGLRLWSLAGRLLSDLVGELVRVARTFDSCSGRHTRVSHGRRGQTQVVGRNFLKLDHYHHCRTLFKTDATET